MKRMLLAGSAGLSCLALLAFVLPVGAMMIAPAPVPQRVATADVVIVGKVTAFGDKTVSVRPFPGATEKSEYQVAIVRVDDALVGAKDVKEIRVGFRLPPPPPPPPVVRPGGGPVAIVPFRKWREPSLVLDQEAMLFLVKHPEADFYVMPAYFSIVNKKDNPGFAGDLAEVKKAARLLADPKAGLESKDGEERLLTAGMLISRYRTPRMGGAPKTEPIDAAQSKLILQTLADADWKAAPRPGLFNQMTAQALFFRLGLQPKDGWTQPKDFNELPDAAQKWLKDNVNTYRIERFVTDEKTEKNDKKD
jgi:hypothetical protein